MAGWIRGGVGKAVDLVAGTRVIHVAGRARRERLTVPAMSKLQPCRTRALARAALPRRRRRS